MIKKILAILTIILGAIHSVLTPMFYKSISIDFLWCLGTGLAFILLGMLNLVADKTKTAISLLITTNIIFTLYSIAIVVVLKEFQAVIGLILVLGLTIMSLIKAAHN